MRRVTPAQANAIIRRAQSEQRRAVQKYNSAVRQQNSEVRRAVGQYNREVDRYNARLRADAQRRQRAMRQLQSRPAVTYTVTQRSTVTLHEAYRLVEQDFDSGVLPPDMARLVDLAETEVANSADVANIDEPSGAEGGDEGSNAAVAAALKELSEDLGRRWTGALYALNPDNPEAARHFCTSARETLLALIELRAPDEAVVAADPACGKTDSGRPSRRAKLAYLVSRFGSSTENLDRFVDSDIEDVVSLVREVNNGTHGTSGRYDLRALRAIRRRAEGSLLFLSTIVRAA